MQTLASFNDDDVYKINALTGAVVAQYGNKTVAADMVKGGQQTAQLGYVYMTGMQARCFMQRHDRVSEAMLEGAASMWGDL